MAASDDIGKHGRGVVLGREPGLARSRDADAAADVDRLEGESTGEELRARRASSRAVSPRGAASVIWLPMCAWTPVSRTPGAFRAVSAISRAREMSMPNLLCFRPVEM